MNISPSNSADQRQVYFFAMCEMAKNLQFEVKLPTDAVRYIEDIHMRVTLHVPAFKSQRLIGTIYWRTTLSQRAGLHSVRYMRGNRGELIKTLLVPDHYADGEEEAWKAFENLWKEDPTQFGRIFMEGGTLKIDIEKFDLQCMYEVI